MKITKKTIKRIRATSGTKEIAISRLKVITLNNQMQVLRRVAARNLSNGRNRVWSSYMHRLKMLNKEIQAEFKYQEVNA